MSKIIVAGCGTEVGKTLVSAILATHFWGDYWKPIQCGDEADLDTTVIKQLIDPAKHRIHPPAYSLKAPLSPHHAARLENVTIDCAAIKPPVTERPLVIEGVGGVCVPLTRKILAVDLFKKWNCPWVVVSKNYLGSINHTLLTLEALKQRNITIAGLVFNGDHNPDSESVILEMAQVPLLGRLFPEPRLDSHTIQRYAIQWQARLSRLSL